jgi:hypothetical protein
MRFIVFPYLQSTPRGSTGSRRVMEMRWTQGTGQCERRDLGDASLQGPVDRASDEVATFSVTSARDLRARVEVAPGRDSR